MSAADVEAYVFGPFELRPHDYTLVREGVVVRINPKAFDVLRLLVERRGHVFDKQSLIAALWPDTIVEEANLSVQMAAVRKVLGGGADRTRTSRRFRSGGTVRRARGSRAFAA